MNRKNKGFTLAEMIATIAIISVITLIATITYTKVRKDILNRQYKNLISLIEASAVRYSSKTGIYNYFVNDLIDEGYLEPDDDNNNLYDPRDHTLLNCHIINVDVDENDNLHATVGAEDFRNNDGCKTSSLDPYVSNLLLTVKITKTDINYLSATNAGQLGSKLTTYSDDLYKNINIVVDGDNRWTNKQLDLSADIKTSSTYVNDLNGATYIWNKNPDTATKSSSYTTSIDEYFNGNYYLDVYTPTDEHYQSKFLLKFDKQKPVIYDEKTKYADPLEEFVWKKEKELIIYATDKDGVGLDRVYAGSKPCEELKKDPSMGHIVTKGSIVHTVTVDDIEAGFYGENGQINICAIDKLGNLAEPGTFTIKMVDITPPQCDYTVGEHDQYQKLARTVDQYCEDDNIINGKTVIGSGCTHEKFSRTWNSTTIQDIITITDNVGWTTDCVENVYVDTTPPICAYTTGEGSEDNWNQSYRKITQYCRDDHSGCRQNSTSKEWTADYGEIIEHGTITIYDKVPKCSQKSLTSSNCANYDSIKDTDENLKNYNNSTACGEGVYLDHVPPVAASYRNAEKVHKGNTAKVTCSDQGSGVNYFHATEYKDFSQVNETATMIKGDEKENIDGSPLGFLESDVGPNGWANFHFITTCRDKAGNEEVDKDILIKGELPPHTLVYGSLVDIEIDSNWSGSTCGECFLRKYRDKSAAACTNYSYECSCEDVPCGPDNSGMGQTCCYSGSDPYYGCKTHANNLTNFGEIKRATPYSSGSSATYVQLDPGSHVYYVLPRSDREPDDYKDHCDDTGCDAGYLCLHFNCYVDKPTSTPPNNTVCGNYYY